MLTVNETKTIREIAEELSLFKTIHRALTFQINSLNWEQPDIALWLDNHKVWSVPVSLSYKLKHAAGNANRFRIHLHPGLIQASEEEIITTFLHETAHVMDSLQNGQTAHGYGWQEQMIRLGQNPNRSRYHNISSCKSRVEKPNPFDNIQI